MCILLLTSVHPDYPLVVIDNRDEFVLRPTSRLGWWKDEATGLEVLSARDLQRAERGAWFGVSRDGRLAVLTNYREVAATGAGSLVYSARSRGGLVTAWLTGDGGVEEGVQRLFEGGFAGVGGFSMVCGELSKKRLAVVSNRARQADDVPLIDLDQGGTWGLSNTVFDDPDEWPKVKEGKQLLSSAVTGAVASHASEEELLRGLFAVLDTNMLQVADGMGFAEFVGRLRSTIFVPAKDSGRATQTGDSDVVETERAAAFETGPYGTQRQTVLLLSRAGRVTMVERALFDDKGNAIPRGQGDVVFRFDIE